MSSCQPFCFLASYRCCQQDIRSNLSRRGGSCFTGSQSTQFSIKSVSSIPWAKSCWRFVFLLFGCQVFCGRLSMVWEGFLTTCSLDSLTYMFQIASYNINSKLWATFQSTTKITLTTSIIHQNSWAIPKPAYNHPPIVPRRTITSLHLAPENIQVTTFVSCGVYIRGSTTPVTKVTSRALSDRTLHQQPKNFILSGSSSPSPSCSLRQSFSSFLSFRIAVRLWFFHALFYICVRLL